MRNRLALAVLSAALLSATASLAQGPTSQTQPAQTQPAQTQPAQTQPLAGAPAPVPEAMPNDIPYGAPVGVEMAEKAITAAAAEARKHNWKMSISVVDPSGNLIAHHTMDGTQYASIAISQAKARTAALYRRPSKALADGINGGSPATLSLLALSAAAASEGGFPIVVDGKLIGAIGASGGFASQDGVTAKAGLTALGIK